MRVKMTKLAAGPSGALRPDRVYNLPEGLALALIQAGAATPERGGNELETARFRISERATAPGARPVTEIRGIGPGVAANLAELGIMTIADLAEANTERLAQDMRGVSKARAGHWIKLAKERITKGH